MHLEKRITCQQQGHEDQNIDKICLQQSCLQKMLCCLCEINHQDHLPKIFSLTKFKIALANNHDLANDTVCLSAKVDQQVRTIYDMLISIQTQFQNFMIIEQAYNNFANTLKHEIMIFNEQLQQMEDKISKGQFQKLANTYVNWIRITIELFQRLEEEQAVGKNVTVGKNVKKVGKRSIYSQFIVSKIDDLNNIEASIVKYQANKKIKDADILELFKMEVSFKGKKLRFSEELKGTGHKLESSDKLTTSEAGTQRMALLEPSLSDSKQITKWKIKIEKLASWIGVGVASLDKIKADNFDFCYTSPGHGNYLISSNGYAWNGYKMEFNSKFQPFAYTTGDTIALEYDPKINKITFKKEGTDSTYSLDIDPDQRPINAAVNLTGAGDTVQLIQ